MKYYTQRKCDQFVNLPLYHFISEIFIPIVSVCPAIDRHAVQREWWDHASYMGVYLLPWMCN